MQGTVAAARRSALALATAGAIALAGCGDDGGGGVEEPPGAAAAPPASAFPKPAGTLDSLLGEVEPTEDIVASPSGAVFEPDPRPQRVGFGLFDVGGAQILDAEVALYAARGADGEALGPFPARVEDLTTQPEFVAQTTADDDAKVVYVTDVPLDRPGEWRLVAVMREGNGFVGARLPSLVVEEQRDIPEVGEPAPRIHTPTAEDVGPDIESIDTRVPPSSMHEHDLADVHGERPVVLLFATPALCVSRVCGPVVDVAEQVKAEHTGDAAFIHMEIYENNEPGPGNLRPQVQAYGLETEPWLFVLDESGRVSTRIEGAFSAAELEQALERAGA